MLKIGLSKYNKQDYKIPLKKGIKLKFLKIYRLNKI